MTEMLSKDAVLSVWIQLELATVCVNHNRPVKYLCNAVQVGQNPAQLTRRHHSSGYNSVMAARPYA